MIWAMIGGNVINFVEQQKRHIFFWRIWVKYIYVCGGWGGTLMSWVMIDRNIYNFVERQERHNFSGG